ncbi:SDR family oxidoreductase [Sinorhizobium sp. BG8]|uniref:SDR family oxidoreductase n=1 Tax=Sinorhizobium sp. BG8 TaxID=2613773 RepID=UPI00193E5D03|nr:SDR family oxidoreductase [Sinorhizobium sp. BG8]
MYAGRGWVEGKIALVTGAGSGIGRAAARLLAAEGATVYLTDIDADAAEATADAIGPAARAIRQDVRDEAGWEIVTGRILSEQGQLDILANCAGIQLTRGLIETSLEDFRHVFQVNVESVFLGTRAAVKAMLPRKSGSIINIASNFANIADGLNTAYCASKAAVAHFTRAAALDCAQRNTRIRVNSIHPGCINTPMLEREIVDVAAKRGDPDTSAVRAEWQTLAPLGIGSPEDIGWAVVYLASDRSPYTTGSELVIDGGHIIR